MIDAFREALSRAQHEETIAEFPAGTHSAADAAEAIGCPVAHIAKSIAFRSEEDVVLVIASGTNRIDRKKVSALIGKPVKPAAPDWVHEKTGFAVGGVAPIGHACPVITVVDRDLLSLTPLWAAAGSPMHVFRTTAEQLVTMTSATIGDIRQA
ncbi:YbaK/EbsC family protein [Novosphingobium terrae]|uniref:YbaK/EbsC family protein n=1 Tax=Novosphingobium terrae TaxID=2726189 RepID=UPI00197D4144|nr:YbaK/EbsC family protein [Novosphingobium terrae]